MAGSNRGPLINKLHKVLRQHYKPVATDSDRPLLEQMLFACCLENAPYDKAVKTYEHLATSFFDWNEVRVSTVNELAEAMRDLPNPAAAASNVKRVLQTVFESTYSFELESLKKQNIGVGIKRLEKLEGTTPFVVAFATQHALSGHFIPLDRGALEVLYIVGIATEVERQSGSVAGLERAIPKSKGMEFSSLLHQLSADLIASPFSPNVKNILLSINPEAKQRLPKRGQKKPLEKPAEPAAAAEAAQNGAPKPEKNASKAAASAKEAKKAPATKSAADAIKKKAAEKKPPAKHPTKPTRAAGAAVSRSARSAPHKAASKQLAKRKPR